jgi:hypothetical protein
MARGGGGIAPVTVGRSSALYEVPNNATPRQTTIAVAARRTAVRIQPTSVVLKVV